MASSSLPLPKHNVAFPWNGAIYKEGRVARSDFQVVLNDRPVDSFEAGLVPTFTYMNAIYPDGLEVFGDNPACPADGLPDPLCCSRLTIQIPK